MRGRKAGLYWISGGLVAAASPRIVPSRVRAAREVRTETPVLAGMAFSHLVISSVLSASSALAPPPGVSCLYGGLAAPAGARRSVPSEG